MDKTKQSSKVKDAILFCPMALINHYTLITVSFFYPQHCPLLRIPALFSHLPHWHNYFQGLCNSANSLCTNQTSHFYPQTCSSGRFCISLLMAIPPSSCSGQNPYCITLKILSGNQLYTHPFLSFLPWSESLSLHHCNCHLTGLCASIPAPRI